MFKVADSTKKIVNAALIMGAALLFLGSEKSNASVEIRKVIKEAENLSVNQDRLLACAVLQRNLKKTMAQDEIKILKEKLLALSRVFFTDSGFEAYENGKALFDKQKYGDSVDKLLEADDLEKGNIDVLHLMTLDYLQLHKIGLAEGANKRAIDMCPIDLEILRDSLVVYIAQEKWDDALKTADHLTKESGDATPQTFQQRGIAQLKLGLKEDATKSLEQAAQKDSMIPDTYYWRAFLKDPPESLKLLTKYVELCKNKDLPHSERDINSCSKLAEAEKRLSP